MGQVLFWLEAAIASVLFVSLGVGIVSRTTGRGRRWAIRIAWWFLTVVPWLLAVGAFAATEIWAGGLVRRRRAPPS